MKLARVAAVAVATAIPTGVAAGAAPTVLLNLQGGYANQTLVACGITHHYTLFHVRRPLHMDGSLQPPPGVRVWRVKVKVKKCARGRFRAVWSGHARGKADGTFKIGYTPRRRGSYFARAYYYGVSPSARSGKQYFLVR
ncbi:MAG TPA: hypothetical protein VIU81_04220 [Gaiellaceae bacterium]